MFFVAGLHYPRGLLQAAGLASFEKRKENKSKIYSYENEEVKFSLELEKQFKASRKAWGSFSISCAIVQETFDKLGSECKAGTTKLKGLHELIADSHAADK